MKDLLFGFITGMLFGMLLQKARVVRYDKQLGALRLMDMTIVKFMLSTIIVAMVGVYVLHDLGLAELKMKPTVLGGNIIGGLLFGVGWGLIGYCPGTSAGALGEGRTDAFWGILGMIAGAGLYVEAYPLMSRTVLTWGDLGVVTVPGLLGINHWVVIVLLALGAILLFRWFERKGL
ncbi:MAG: YeeE/YedE family protein [Methanothrix sp.]|nr:YeeE/YedE family protein [Methanothrix sp.]